VGVELVDFQLKALTFCKIGVVTLLQRLSKFNIVKIFSHF